MLPITRQKVDSDIEKRIVLGMILNNSFLESITDIYRPDYFIVPYYQKISKWCFDFYMEYKTPIKFQVEDVFNDNKSSLEESERDNIQELLNILSEYSTTERINIPFLIDRTYEHFEKRSLELLFEEGRSSLEQGNINNAKDLLTRHDSLQQVTIQIIDPFSSQEINKTEEENIENRLFKLDGALGQMVGHLCRSEFLSMSAPAKGSKSHWMLEIGMQAIENKCNVYFMSHEMSLPQNKDRIYRKITGMPEKIMASEETGEEKLQNLIVPVFDCVHNIQNICKLAQRQNQVLLDLDYGEGGLLIKPKFTPDNPYKPCTACRGEYNSNRELNFKTDYWFDYFRNIQGVNTESILKKAKTIKKLYGDHFRLKCYPNYTATFDDIERDLDYLEKKQGFIPDVIIDDYLDIHGEESNSKSEQGSIDLAWKRAKRISTERKLLYVTCEQAKAGARNKQKISVNDSWSDSKKKKDHLNISLAINRTDKEVQDGVCRITTLLNRKQKVSFSQVMCLMQLELAMCHLDSEIYF